VASDAPLPPPRAAWNTPAGGWPARLQRPSASENPDRRVSLGGSAR